jgi:hypothetical protein
MKESAGVRPQAATAELAYHSVRHITCPENLNNERKVYVGYTQVSEIEGLSTDENVRDYLLEAEGRQRRRPTQVHRAIRNTLENNPDDFAVLNGGVVIVARACFVDEQKKVLVLTRPSIINGSQTQGVIRDFHREIGADDMPGPASMPHVKFEVIVTNDEQLIAEVSIARNFQDNVMSVSIAGRLGQLDELERHLQMKMPGSKLQKSETSLSEDYIKTERLLQVITALVPAELWPKDKDFNKAYTYSRKAQCLKEFRELHEAAHDASNVNYADAVKLYEFYLDVAAQAWELHTKWKTHQGFQGTKLRAFRRDDDGSITDVPDGIVFPILASLSVFAKKTSSGWRICPPARFTDDELIKAAKSAYMEIASSNPGTMGKSRPCYVYLEQITSIYKRLS